MSTDQPTAHNLTVTPDTMRRAEALGFERGDGDPLLWALSILESDDPEGLAHLAALVSAGHSDHCAKRQVWGDGVCTCKADGTPQHHTMSPPAEGWPPLLSQRLAASLAATEAERDEARAEVARLTAENQRLRSLLDALAEHGVSGFRLSVDYIDEESGTCGYLVTGPTGKEALMADLWKAAFVDAMRQAGAHTDTDGSTP